MRVKDTKKNMCKPVGVTTGGPVVPGTADDTTGGNVVPTATGTVPVTAVVTKIVHTLRTRLG